MAFVVPSQSLDTGSPLLGALTGFTEGLSQGIQTRRRQDLAQQELQLRAQDQALRQAAFAHGLQNEADVKAWAQRFGEFKAWDMAGAGAQPMQGPSTSGGTAQPESGIGPPQQFPASAPLGMGPPDQQARISKMLDLARTAPNMETAQALMSAFHEDEAKRAVLNQAQSILGGMQDRRLKGAYTIRRPGGVMDDTGNVNAQALEDEARTFLSGPDAQNPQAVAQYFDHLQEQDRQLRATAAASDTEMHLRDIQNEDLESAIQEKRAAKAPPEDIAALVSIQKNLAHDNITREEAAKQMQEEMSGLGSLKRQEIRSRIDWERAREAGVQTPSDRLQVALARVQAWGATRENLQALHDAATAKIAADKIAAGKHNEDERSGRVESELDALEGRTALEAARTDKDWPKADTEEKQKAIVDKYRRLQQRKNGSLVLPGGGALGPKSPADILRDEVNSKKITTQAQLEARAKELGVTLK